MHSSCKSEIDFNEAFIPCNELQFLELQFCALTHRLDVYRVYISDTGS